MTKGYTAEVKFQSVANRGSYQAIFAAWHSTIGGWILDSSGTGYRENGFTYSSKTWGDVITARGTCPNTTTLTMDIFSQHELNNAHGHYPNAKIFYIWVKDTSGNLILDAKPAKDPDGVVCFYDEVSETYMYPRNATLIGGPSL